MGRVAPMRKRWIQGFGGKPERMSHLEYIDVDRRIILRLTCNKQGEMWWVGVDWIDVAVVREKWQAVVNKVTNLLFPESANNFD